MKTQWKNMIMLQLQVRLGLQCNNKFDTNHEVEYVVVVFTSQL